MAIRIPKPMKKHEACYHLNVILQQKKCDLESAKKREIETTFINPVTHQKEAVTPEQIAQRERWQAERVRDLELQIDAIDIAASALTKN